MKIDYKTARGLCTDSEFSLVEDSKPKSLTQFKAGELRAKAKRARTLSDKWRDRGRSQGNSSDGSAARSAEKQELFAEVLLRFEKRIERIGVVPAVKSPAKTAVKAVKKTAKKAATAKMPKLPVARKTSRKSQLLDHTAKAEQHARRSASRLASSGLTTRVKGHVSSQGRRAQAARSSRSGS